MVVHHTHAITRKPWGVVAELSKSDHDLDALASNSTSVSTKDDLVSQRTNAFLETFDDEDDDDEEDDEDERKDQIFDPMSFWTERSGRFPRNQ